MEGGAWWAAVHGVAESRTRLSGFTLTNFALWKFSSLIRSYLFMLLLSPSGQVKKDPTEIYVKGRSAYVFL